MKKFMVVLMALLFAGSAFAQDAPKGPDFKYGFFGIAYGVSGSQDDLEYDYTHIRVRPMFTLGNDNVKGVVRFEIDQDYGKEATAAGADNGTDNQVVEVKWAYMEVNNMLVPNLTFTAGLNAYFLPLVIDNDFAMFDAAYDFGMGKVQLSYIKSQEYNYVTKTAAGVKTQDDIESYAVQIPVKAGAITITPAYVYTKVGKDINDDQWETAPDGLTASKYDEESFFHDGKLANYAIAANGDFGMVTLDLAFDYSKGKVKETEEGDGAVSLTTTDFDVKTYAFDAALGIKPAEGIKISLFYTLYSGDDKADDEITAHVAMMDSFYGAPDGRLFILDAAGVAANGGNQPFDLGATMLGLNIYGINVDAAFGKFSCLAQYAYVTTNKDNTAGDNFLGHEVDLKVAYEVAPKTTLFAEFGYVIAGDDNMGLDVAGKAEDVQEVAWGLTTSI